MLNENYRRAADVRDIVREVGVWPNVLTGPRIFAPCESQW